MILLTGGGGTSSQGGVSSGVSGRGGAWWRHLPGRLLLRAVRILLECILVSKVFHFNKGLYRFSCCFILKLDD